MEETWAQVSANSFSPDSDLGARLVTTGVDVLSETEIREALQSGTREARDMQQAGLARVALLFYSAEVSSLVPVKVAVD